MSVYETLPTSHLLVELVEALHLRSTVADGDVLHTDDDLQAIRAELDRRIPAPKPALQRACGGCGLRESDLAWKLGDRACPDCGEVWPERLWPVSHVHWPLRDSPGNAPREHSTEWAAQEMIYGRNCRRAGVPRAEMHSPHAVIGWEDLDNELRGEPPR